MKYFGIPIFLILSLFCVTTFSACDINNVSTPVSASGVTKASVKIQKGADNLTVEQRNVRDRLLKDNEPGAIKHLYLISAVSGDVLLYSTVRGKVTSSNKRLVPCVTADDGTYGSSGEYIFWWDSKGIYHQQFLNTSGVIIHVSDQPLAVKKVVINLEQKTVATE